LPATDATVAPCTAAWLLASAVSAAADVVADADEDAELEALSPQPARPTSSASASAGAGDRTVLRIGLNILPIGKLGPSDRVPSSRAT
jgi:hypothetical protein